MTGSTDVYAYEPKRLISNGQGRIIEQDKAPLEYKLAEAKHALERAEKTSRPTDIRWANRAAREAELFEIWATGQREKGRPGSELTFGRFVRESGLWKPIQ